MNIEEFVNNYLQEHRHDVLLSPYNGLIDFTNALKEQMLKEAVEGEIINAGYPTKIELNTFYSKFEHGQEVKLIFVKED